jgi:triacylglycerol esterase/lipase EstA (alpha/beta hydrolase family)
MKNRLIMFVHGLGGAGESTWCRAGCAGFPELIASDPAIRDEAQIAFYQYPTSLFRLPLSPRLPGIRVLADGLRSLLETRYRDQEAIALVCHSLGGLVARKYLVDEVKRGSDLKVDKLLLYAVPNQGAGLARVGEMISWRHSQLRQLCRESDFLEELNREWAHLDMEGRVEVMFVVAGQDGVVDEESAEPVGQEESQVIVDADHGSW